MGAWGEGNFDNDAAGDFLDQIILQLKEKIVKSLSIGAVSSFDLDEDGDAQVMASMDILVTLCTNYKKSPPVEVSAIEQWKLKYLNIYDEVIDLYGAKEPYKHNRRKVIEDTFDQLIALGYQYPP